MRKFLKWTGGLIAIVVLIAGGLLLRTLVFAGQFTQITPHFAGSCRAITGVVGAEDLEVDTATGTLYLSAYDRRAVSAGAPVNGALYRLDLNDKDAEPIPLWRGEGEGDFRPHGISLYRSGNGAVRLFVINHPADGRQVIEIFDVVDGWLNHVESLSDPLFVSPNDLTATGMRAFYAGNDVISQHPVMKMLEMMIPLRRANVIYFDGEKASVAASGIAFANGMAVSPDGLRFYVAEMTGKAVRTYERQPVSGALTLLNTISLQSFPDNINLDADGALWIGAHPRLGDVMRHASDAMVIAPSQVLKITPKRAGGGRIEEIYLSEGEQISAVATAAVYKNKMALGPIFDSRIMFCDLP